MPTGGSRRRRAESTPADGLSFPPRIFAQASPRSIGGVSLFDASQINAATVANFYSAPDVVSRAAVRLREAGFDVLQVTPMTINIAGSADTYRRAFQTRIVTEERPVIKPLAVEATATFLETPDTPGPGFIATTGTPFEDIIEGVAIEEPRFYMAPSMFPPVPAYWHLRLPGDLSLACNADRAHRSGVTGRGIRVAMVDSGWYRHPYFTGRGYRVAPVMSAPGAAEPLADESGHGTGESANIFALAPDVTLLPVKMSVVNTIAAFQTAISLGPDIISCSWGSNRPTGPLSAADQALAAAIATAIAAGIIVVCAAGNGHWSFPAQHPDVIAAGGVFLGPDGSLQASDYASGFASTIYPGRRVPDLCGLVGMRPKGLYLMLPVEPGDRIDSTPWNDPYGRGLQGGAYPDGDETAPGDGWAVFSGTSAAAPQLAGAAALVRQTCPNLSPAEVRNVLMMTARDVTSGAASPGTGGPAAAPGADSATGSGLVDAYKAVRLAGFRRIGPGRSASVAPPGAELASLALPDHAEEDGQAMENMSVHDQIDLE